MIASKNTIAPDDSLTLLTNSFCSVGYAFVNFPDVRYFLALFLIHMLTTQIAHGYRHCESWMGVVFCVWQGVLTVRSSWSTTSRAQIGKDPHLVRTLDAYIDSISQAGCCRFRQAGAFVLCRFVFLAPTDTFYD